MTVMERTVDWVICRFREDVLWVKDVVPGIPGLRKVIIYNKGEPLDAGVIDAIQAATSAAVTEQALPNVGREGNAYIVHIHVHYDDLADMNIFTQGSVDDKVHSFDRARQWITNLELPCLFICNMDMHADETHGQHFPTDEQGYPGIGRSQYTFGEFARKFFGMEQIPAWMSLCGCIKTTREKLRRHSRDAYARLLTESGLGSHVNPEEGFYLERLWYGAVCA